MSSVVCVPAYNRPELLSVTLKHVQRANRADENFYHFQFDKGFSEENWEVIKKFQFGQSVAWLENKLGCGNSENTFEGLELGLMTAEEIGADTLHLLEDDLWVGKDYFDAHERIHKQFKPFAVSLCRNQHRRIDPIQDPALVYLCQDYQSIGVSFPLDSVREILVHNTPEYFEDPEGYLRTMFPNSRFGGLYTEQDGVVQRIIEKNNYQVAFSNVPRAFHAGYWSYHRAGQEPEGTLEEKIAQLEAMSEEEMNRRSTYKDIKFVDLDKDYGVQEFYLE